MNNPNFKFLLVQGRAIPQRYDSIQYFPSNWKEEFPIINTLGFTGIEWIYDEKSELTNPILTKTGRMEMSDISKKNNVDLENIVFDWFLAYPLLQKDKFSLQEKLKKLLFLLDVSRQSGFKRVIFPLLEQNSLRNDDEKKIFVKILEDNVLDYLDKWKIEFNLETSLPTIGEKLILKKINSDKVKICFDMGNSASYGFAPDKVINELGKYIGSVHVKDRKFNGSTVPLGQGDVKFQTIFTSLKKIDFNGPLSFQVYRDIKSNNPKILSNAINFINSVIDQVYN